MDVNKNSYTFLFAIVMVVLVAAILSIAAIQLKPHQSKNIELEKKQNILSSIGKNVDRETAEILYSEIITSEIVLNSKGELVEGNAFDIDLSSEMKKDIKNQLFPLFISEINNKKKYIVPLRGKGLWGPIWGFIAIEEDLNTVFGAVFDHKSETPGLGAEINQDFFQDPFQGKNIFDEENNFKSILVKKGGAEKNDKYAVDAISGGTITCDGVTNMLYERLDKYIVYFDKLKENNLNRDSVYELDSNALVFLNHIKYE